MKIKIRKWSMKASYKNTNTHTYRYMVDFILNNNNNNNLSTFSWHLQKWLNKKKRIKTATTSEKNKSFWNWIEFNCFDSLACILSLLALSRYFFSRASLRDSFFFQRLSFILCCCGILGFLLVFFFGFLF